MIKWVYITTNEQKRDEGHIHFIDENIVYIIEKEKEKDYFLSYY
ncbi:hypothetical protein [Clostridium tetanomorphum]|nr:hypothetical protein [Clostridium tetanomorphum]NRZ96338.1 hypothetical protein [Clostridium tetanomorphum]